MYQHGGYIVEVAMDGKYSTECHVSFLLLLVYYFGVMTPFQLHDNVSYH